MHCILRLSLILTGSFLIYEHVIYQNYEEMKIIPPESIKTELRTVIKVYVSSVLYILILQTDIFTSTKNIKCICCKNKRHE